MLLLSSVGQTGDQVTLMSPSETFTNHSLITFSYYMRLDPSDVTAMLTVYMYSIPRGYEQVLFRISGNKNSTWHTARGCLPPGSYRLAFVGTIGLKYMSDIAIGSVNIYSEPTCSLQPTSSASTGYVIFSLVWLKNSKCFVLVSVIHYIPYILVYIKLFADFYQKLTSSLAFSVTNTYFTKNVLVKKKKFCCLHRQLMNESNDVWSMFWVCIILFTVNLTFQTGSA